MNTQDVYRHNTGLQDPYQSRLKYVDWGIKTFEENDLFITLNCPKIKNLGNFIFSKVASIERQVFLNKQSNLYRIAVLVQKPQRHIHMLMKNVEFKHPEYSSFKHLVSTKFARSLPDHHAVSVQAIDTNVKTVLEYMLLRQDDCQIDTSSLYLPAYESLKIAA